MNATTFLWGARVELSRGKSTVRLNSKAPATNATEARENITAAVGTVWPGWAVKFITQPKEIAP